MFDVLLTFKIKNEVEGFRVMSLQAWIDLTAALREDFSGQQVKMYKDYDSWLEWDSVDSMLANITVQYLSISDVNTFTTFFPKGLGFFPPEHLVAAPRTNLPANAGN